jgi:hypothetical protein
MAAQWHVGATLLLHHRHPEMGPIATLRAEAHSSDVGHGCGMVRAQVHCVVARQHRLQKIELQKELLVKEIR